MSHRIRSPLKDSLPKKPLGKLNLAVNADNVVALKQGLEPSFRESVRVRLDPSDYRRIEQLRYFARLYALHPPGDWEQACRVIAIEASASLKSHAFAMLGAFDSYASRPMLFYQQRSQSVSECEMWICRLLDAVAKTDHANIRALLSFRLPLIAHRRVAFLAHGLLEALNGD